MKYRCGACQQMATVEGMSLGYDRKNDADCSMLVCISCSLLATNKNIRSVRGLQKKLFGKDTRIELSKKGER